MAKKSKPSAAGVVADPQFFSYLINIYKLKLIKQLSRLSTGTPLPDFKGAYFAKSISKQLAYQLPFNLSPHNVPNRGITA